MLYTLVLLELHTGARWRELLDLRVEAVNLERAEIAVWRSKTKRPGTLPLPPACVAALGGTSPALIRACHGSFRVPMAWHP